MITSRILKHRMLKNPPTCKTFGYFPRFVLWIFMLNWLGSLIGGIFDSTNNAAQLASTAAENKKSRDFQASQAQSQRDFDMQMYERQRQDALDDRNFNSIGSLVEQYKAAGLNPDALAGSAPQASSIGSVAPPYGSQAVPDWVNALSPLQGVLGGAVSGLATLANTAINFMGAKDKHKASAIELELRKLDIEPKKLASTYAQFEREVLDDPSSKDRIINQLRTRIENDDNEEGRRSDKLYNEMILLALQTKALRDNTEVKLENGAIGFQNEDIEQNIFNSLFKSDQREQNSFVAWSNKHTRDRQKTLDDFDDFVMRMQKSMSEEQLKQLQQASLSGEAQTGLYKVINELDINDKWKSVLMSAVAVLLNKINVAPINLQMSGQTQKK